MLRLDDSNVIYNNSIDLGDVYDLINTGGGFSISLPDGSMVYIPEEDCTANEQEVFAAWKEAHANDPEPQPDINAIRQQKIDELWKECNKAILAGFHSSVSGTDILYGFDEMDQNNLTQQLVMIANGLATEPIFWKGKGETELLAYTIEQFLQLCADGQAHKTNYMYRYYQLKESVQRAETVEEIETIEW